MPRLLTIIPACAGLPLWAAGPVRGLLTQNRLEEALPICRQYEVLLTTDKDSLFACAWVYFRSDRADSAQKILERERKSYLLPEYQLLLAYDYVKRKQYDEARNVLNAVSSRFKRTQAALTAQELSGEIYELQGQLDTAAFIYKQLVGDDPRRGRAQFGLGRYYQAHGDIPRARTHLSQAASLWPKHSGVRLALAMLSLNQGNLPEAAHWLSQAYKLNKADPQVLEQMGILFERKGLVNSAIKHWQKAVELKKDSQLAKEKLALYTSYTLDALMEAKQWSQALAEMEKSGKVIANDPKLALKRGIIYRNLGKFEKAVGELLSYVNVNPKDPLARRELGICYLNLKLPEQAADNFARAISEEPNNGMNYAWIAFLLESKGNFADAKESWRRAIELLRDPGELEKANRRLASVEKKLEKESKKKEKAEKEQDKH